MIKCKICNSNEANKKGSHIVPHFLLKRIDNEEGSTYRDKEFGFTISELGISSYFGRSITPEKLEESYGEVTDELISRNLLPLIEDNIFCKECEEKLGVIESEYSNIINTKSEEENNYQSFTNGQTAFLFWISIIWRLSIAKYSGCRLDSNNEELLFSILNAQFSNDLKSFLDYDNVHISGKIKYKLLRSNQFSDSNSTILFCDPELQNPYFFVIDEFIIIINFNSENFETGYSKIDSELIKVEHNSSIKSEITRSVTSDVITSVQDYFYDESRKRYIKNLKEEIDLVHLKFGGKGQVPEKIKDEIISKIVYDEKVPFAVKYSDKHKATVIYKVLKSYAG